MDTSQKMERECEDISLAVLQLAGLPHTVVPNSTVACRSVPSTSAHAYIDIYIYIDIRIINRYVYVYGEGYGSLVKVSWFEVLNSSPGSCGYVEDIYAKARSLQHKAANTAQQDQPLSTQQAQKV